MGLLDILKGFAGAKKSAPAAQDPLGPLGSLLSGLGGGNPLLKMLLPMLLGGGALGGLGGLGGLLGKFTQAGMGTKVNSWVGTGANEPLDASEVEQALGAETLGAMAKESGMGTSEVAGGLAGMLPGLVNQLTPKGSVPDQGQLGGLMKGLDLKSLLG